MALAELVAKEHAAGLHSKPMSFCPECGGSLPEQSDQPVSEPAEEATQPKKGNLESIFARWRAKVTVTNEPEYVPSTPSTWDGFPECSKCESLRFVRNDLAITDAEFGKAVPCPACSHGILMQRRLDYLLGELPEKLRDHRLDNFLADTPLRRATLAKIEKWLADPGNPWLYLYSPVGRGKSHLAVGALKRWIEAGHSGAFKLSRDLLDRIRAGYDDGSYRDVMQSLIDAQLLVIDDLGSERHKENTDDDWASEKIFQIIGGRYDNNGRCIITANYSLDELANRLGNPRVSSRIYELATDEYILNLTKLPDHRRVIGGVHAE